MIIMSWRDDGETWEKLDAFLIGQKETLNEFLQSITQHQNGNMMFPFLILYGKFVIGYSELREIHTENDSFDLILARIANDPIAQHLSASMMAGFVDRSVGQ